MLTLFSLITLLASSLASAEPAAAGDEELMDGDNHPAFQWGPCDPTIVQDPSISCSFFEIPLDYHDRSAGTGRVAVAKANATTERFGTLFINPGGPGASGLDALDQLRSTVLSLTGGHYDLVSWDPRGVGPLTIPGDIVCFSSVEDYNTFWDGTIELTGIEMTGNFTDQQDIDALLSQAPVMQRKYEELGERCLRQPSGKYMKYVGTAASVRDMVAMADVLDGPKSLINLFGLSYGTIAGAWFMNMFPERVGRVVLDGVVNPTFLATEETTTFWPKQLVDADKVYNAFIAGCALAGPDGCSITTQGQTLSNVDADIQALLQRAHDAARKNSSVPVTSADVRAQLGSAMYSPDEWATFANVSYPQAVDAVDAETSGGVDSRAVKRQRKRQNSDPDAVIYSGQAIECGDSVNRKGTTMDDVFRGIISSSRTSSHLFSSVWPNPLAYCPFWPVRAVERYQGPFNKKLANRVLVLSNTYDPITPVSGARALIELLGEDATLVLLNGFGHTTVEPSQCLNEIISAYFITGELPEDGNTVCEVDADYEVFTGIDTEAILASLGS
ncbi:alpha/beta-hydrolase [Cubamyces sp. BRFM 1775]|nr:alpha/beta-hydrolase [Cubamyces sp. BRFM 1775]